MYLRLSNPTESLYLVFEGMRTQPNTVGLLLPELAQACFELLTSSRRRAMHN